MLLLHAIILAGLAITLLGICINLTVFRSPKPPLTPVSRGRVSILIPARNEERSIAACVTSLMAQDYPDFELIVLDDSSSDRTGFIVAGLIAGTHHRLLSGTALPEGWVGKNWACHQLSQVATGDWLFFTDADTAHAPVALSAAIAMATDTRADLLSAWPRLRTLTLGEKLVIPVLHILALGWFPIALLRYLQNHPRVAARFPNALIRSWGGANGQFLLFRRDAYRRIGGHETHRNHIVEDLALGREVAGHIRDGMRLVNCDGSTLVDCRMYQSFGEVINGFTKNVRAAFEDSLATYCATGALQLTLLFLPFVLLFIPSQRSLAWVEVALIYLIRLILTIRMRTSWVGMLLHPIGQFLAMAIGVRSWINTAGSGVEWKGRTYRPTFN